MIKITDSLGRALYDLDTHTMKRYHPYTGEQVSDNYEYPHIGNKDNGTVTALSIALIFVLIGVVTGCLLFR